MAIISSKYGGYFPYPKFRDNQEQMLDKVQETLIKGHHAVLMIDAPTGSGKTSVISPILANKIDKKVIVAVRTNSQIEIYLDEIEKILKNTSKSPTISYMVGKDKVCKLSVNSDKCKSLVENTKEFIEYKINNSQLEKYDPFLDRNIVDELNDSGWEISKNGDGYLINDSSELTKPDSKLMQICPYFLFSKIGRFDDNTSEIYFLESSKCSNKAMKLLSSRMPYKQLKKTCADVCPYEVMASASKSSDISILMFNHILDETIRTPTYMKIGAKSDEVILLIDEAHNLGNEIEKNYSEILDIKLITSAIENVESLKNSSGKKGKRHEIIANLFIIVHKLGEMFESQKKYLNKKPIIMTHMDIRFLIDNVFKDIIDPGMIDNVISDIYGNIDLIYNNDKINSEDEIKTLSKVIQFLYSINNFNKDTDTPFVLIKKTDDNDSNNVVFEIKSVDPSDQISKIVDLHYTTIMMSGTFSPVEDYELYYFGNKGRSEKCTLSNSFKSENRLIIGVTDVNTTLNCRNDSVIIRNYEKCIESIAKTHGNVGIFYSVYDVKEIYKNFISKYAKLIGKDCFDQVRNTAEEKVINDFICAAKRNGGVLNAVCGGKLSEGLDYSGDSLKSAIVIGLPLAQLVDFQKIKKEYYEKIYGKEYGSFIAYRLPAMNKALQAIGRVIRAKNETGILILADDRFTKNTKYDVNQYLPSWIKDEMIHCKSMEIEGVIHNWVENKKSIEKPIVKPIRKEPKRVRNRAIPGNISGNLDLFKENDKIHESLIWKFTKYGYDVNSLLDINDKISKDIYSIENLNIIPNIPNVKSYLTQFSIEFKKESERLLSEKDNKKIRRELEYYVI